MARLRGARGVERLPPEIREAMAPAIRRDTRGLVEIVGPNGEVGVDLQGRFQHVPVATVNEDGSVTIEEY